MITETLIYYLSQHPAIVTFRWSHIQSWGSTWSFVLTSIAFYLTFCALVHLFLQIFIKRGRTVPLGPIPAVYSLFMALISAVIFSGILLSTASEIQETRWFWRRSKTPFQWLLCFPLGTRPSGRVFFWSYMYYLSRYLHMFRTFFTILRFRKLVSFQLVNNSILTFMSFLWLEFSQSFQVLAILLATLVYSIVYGYRFWTAVGGCNGIGAWWFNSVLNGAILFLFLNFHVKMYLGKRKEVISEAMVEAEMMKVK
ncbi:FATTY ACID ACYL TRANSFERASE-RELATED [Salix purpurea]|uniref:FATTY ACID ACYL TRANSFERASE-RELATED n=1 Tax=Salix purpurea TaxID=77065 RepID=A0A9Q0V1S9_SALPP|nr:FATTY ACID ACYL TRANSFERASE-RELATED [Salix purpurea]